ncbi:hypothetical protein StoSoilB22_25060 [Arthrobacter sp. StoSoilB22]|nr:hypothetical protein StoSoilB22_25060 [Arthrobacter sp. StoSoilB22]
MEPIVVPSGKVRTPAGQPSTTSPAALPGWGKEPVINGAGAEGSGKPVGVVVTGGRTSSGLAVEGPPSLLVPSVLLSLLLPPLPSVPDAGLPDWAGSPAPPGVGVPEAVALEPGVGAEDDVLWAAVGPGFAAI